MIVRGPWQHCLLFTLFLAGNTILTPSLVLCVFSDEQSVSKMQLILGICIFMGVTSKQDLRIAWMAPEREYYGVSAGSSVLMIKAALAVVKIFQYLNGTFLSDHRIS